MVLKTKDFLNAIFKKTTLEQYLNDINLCLELLWRSIAQFLMLFW